MSTANASVKLRPATGDAHVRCAHPLGQHHLHQRVTAAEQIRTIGQRHNLERKSKLHYQEVNTHYQMLFARYTDRTAALGGLLAWVVAANARWVTVACCDGT